MLTDSSQMRREQSSEPLHTLPSAVTTKHLTQFIWPVKIFFNFPFYKYKRYIYQINKYILKMDELSICY